MNKYEIAIDFITKIHIKQSNGLFPSNLEKNQVSHTLIFSYMIFSILNKAGTLKGKQTNRRGRMALLMVIYSQNNLHQF